MIYLLLTPLVIIALILIVLHIGFKAPRIVETNTPENSGMSYVSMYINTQKNKKLFAWFIPVEEETAFANSSSVMNAPLIIIVHGWGSNMEFMLPVAKLFHQASLNVLLFDARCHGKSDGDNYSALPRFSEDIAHVIKYARKNIVFNGQIILLGHSVGAGAVLYYTSVKNDISAVISLSAFADPEWIMTRYLEKIKLPKKLIDIFLSYIQWVIGHKFAEIAPVNTIKKITIPVLLIHGRDDNTVPVSDAYVIHNNNKNIKILIIDEADHDLAGKINTHGYLLIDFLKQLKLL